MSRAAAALLLALLTAQAVQAQPQTQRQAQGQPQVPMTMHRTQAGKLDASGWTPAQSSSGAVSARLPCLYNDFRADTPDPSEPVSRTHVVGCVRADGAKFAASRIEYRGGAARAQAFFKQFAAAPAWQASKGAEVKALDVQGRPAVDVAVSEPARCGFLRMVQIGDDNLLLVAEAPGAACSGLRPAALGFFDSVRWKAR